MRYKVPATRVPTEKKKSVPAALAILLIVAIGGASFWFIRKSAMNSPQIPVASTPPAKIDEPLHPIKTQADNSVPTQTTVHDNSIPPIKDGLAPVISRLNTKEPVVFLGIDDGANKQPFEVQMMKDNNVKASLFLANRFIYNDPNFFMGFVYQGSLIEDHTLDHKLLPNLSYDEQKQEICGMADLEAKEYGRRPILFRPPGGSYNQDTQKATAACGMKAVVLWDSKANGGAMQYQNGHSLRPGDIVLMHFRPEFKKDMQAFLNAQKAAGLHTELLEDWTQN